jgi:signal transduction histidine kinase
MSQTLSAETERVLGALPIAAAFFDERLELRFANRRFRNVAGLGTSDSRAAIPLTEAFPAASTNLSSALSGASRGRVEIIRQASFREGESTRLVDVCFTPLDRGLLVCLQDVTEAETLRRQVRQQGDEENRLEQHVEARTRELIELQEQRAHERRLAAVGQLAAGVMHDVNNALNPIMAAAFLLGAKADDPAAVRDYAERIAKAAETGAATAARVGRFIRQDPPQAPAGDSVDLSQLAEEVAAMTRPLWAERSGGGVVRFDASLASPAVVRGVAGELREALLNLVQNALDAMPHGGRLAVRTFTTDSEAVIEVADSGIGMEEEVRERAFDPFFSTKGANGSGLGLAEVYGVVRRHRGVATIESAPDEGTTVQLRFPRAAAAEQPTREVARHRSPRRILVVEDHADGREFMRTVLEMDGHAVDAVGTLAEAMARIERRAGTDEPYDVLVTDIGLPDGSGWDLVARAHERWPAIVLGVVTGWEPAVPFGTACDFTMRKPVRPAELLARVAM